MVYMVTRIPRCTKIGKKRLKRLFLVSLLNNYQEFLYFFPVNFHCFSHDSCSMHLPGLLSRAEQVNQAYSRIVGNTWSLYG